MNCLYLFIHYIQVFIMGASVGDVRAGKVGCLASAFAIAILGVCCIIAIFCQLPLWVAPNILKVSFLLGQLRSS